jgi:hypothetical protein
MRTVVLQSFRTTRVPDWMRRCLASVRSWAERCGFEYEFVDDRIFDFCGPLYSARAAGNIRMMTNLARLELARARLTGAYERAIWLDADVFIFAPERLSLDLGRGYAFGLEVWLLRGPDGTLLPRVTAHNAVFCFTRNQPDLDFLIATIRHLVMTREIDESLKVGVKLITALQPVLEFPMLTAVGMFGQEMIQAVADDDPSVLGLFARATGYPVFAANIGYSFSTDPGEALITAAMDNLERTRGDIINRHLGAESVPVQQSAR